MTVITTDEFWDCECEKNYIQIRIMSRCPICQALRDDQPDSRLNEVIDMLMKSAGVTYATYDYETNTKVANTEIAE